jgi:pyruvate, water dikinase
LIYAITEVFASLFGPDPIEYRLSHRLLDYHEEMGIMIQEVVGKPVGRYYFPSFAGVAFSNNEFRWSSRIKREDGLIRLVPGLGTRAVDRLTDDYPVLISPGQPRLRVNVSLDEIVRYSPKKIDLINLNEKTFETMDLRALLKECGSEFPAIHHLVSVLEQEAIRQPVALGTDFVRNEFVFTFENLVSRTPFIPQIRAILSVLQEAFDHPVDIEFAHDGTDLYLLQCRSQSYREESMPASIPKEILRDQIIFSANRYISNGTVSEITHIIYVNPREYSQISDYQTLVSVGRAIGRLNQILPKRQFVLVGPGRWGSRGDIRLGVSVTYSDINNTAMLIEIALKGDEFIVDPSFGTHFFQDLVETGIRYLPLYPDDAGIIFNEDFLVGCENVLPRILPDLAELSKVIRVIDVPASTSGKVLQVFMNADSDQAIALLAEPSGELQMEADRFKVSPLKNASDVHWRWRLQAVEGIAAQLNPERFGVKAFYVIGSVKNATAGPMSDIDLLIHFQGTELQRNELLAWLEGWSASLDQINYQRTGNKTRGILDIHLVTDEEVEKRTGFAAKIGAVTDAARPLVMGRN